MNSPAVGRSVVMSPGPACRRAGAQAEQREPDADREGSRCQLGVGMPAPGREHAVALANLTAVVVCLRTRP